MVLKVNCPQCGRKIEWIDENKWKPFCCERCKLIDLGEWAAGNHRIPGEPVIDPEDDPNSFH
jgi:endogenous inhibitor of DNA gyrase (YacG/DUF329 family)